VVVYERTPSWVTGRETTNFLFLQFQYIGPFIASVGSIKANRLGQFVMEKDDGDDADFSLYDLFICRDYTEEKFRFSLSDEDNKVHEQKLLCLKSATVFWNENTGVQ
jgi:hypothetical protein